MKLAGISHCRLERRVIGRTVSRARRAICFITMCSLVFGCFWTAVGRAQSSSGISISTAAVPGAVPGLNGAVVTGDGQYGIVTQYDPVAGATSLEAFDLSNPGNGPLTTLNLDPLFEYPTNLQVDQGDIVSFRATQWSTPDPVTGDQTASEVLIFVQLDTPDNGLAQNGRVRLDRRSIVTIPINPVSGFDSGTVPVSLAVGNG
ncbi:MAG TPA: hypothetical protein VI756_24500, partial [Blastocatellia bacterium]